jgi:N-acetylglutamate synthase-like GNAT family acetyltransferase
MMCAAQPPLRLVVAQGRAELGDGQEVLLRSIVVVPEHRRAGNGRRIVAALLDRSREDGAKRA